MELSVNRRCERISRRERLRGEGRSREKARQHGVERKSISGGRKRAAS